MIRRLVRYKGRSPAHASFEVLRTCDRLDCEFFFPSIRNGSGLPFQAAVVPELLEGLVANDGRPRSEATMSTLTDPFRINPPIQAPGEPPSSNPGHPGLFPFLGGTPVKGEK